MDSPNTSADYFADSSAETVAPKDLEPESSSINNLGNLMVKTDQEFPPAPVIDFQTQELLNASLDTSLLVNKFLCESNLPVRICCPFCIFDFGFEVLLKDHIKQTHEKELKLVLQSAPGVIDFHQCPFCQSKFYHRHLLPKHIIRNHEMCVVNMFSGFSPEKYVYCRFCPHKIMRKHFKLLIIHIEKKHYPLFEKYVITKYSNITKSMEDLFEQKKPSSAMRYESPGLSVDLLKLSTNDDEEGKKFNGVRPILKAKTAYPLDQSECVADQNETQVYANLNVPPKNLRRKLRFNLPDSPETNEIIPGKKKKRDDQNKKSKWAFSSKSKKLKRSVKAEKNKENLEDPESVSDLATQLCRFKCGLCSESFHVNAKLLDHLKKKHKGFVFQARYKCGVCHAKFYKNDYLVRHCWHNHGPLCLKTPLHAKDSGMQF
ncbi:uncharacterized protein LOC106665861 [Cimex lectularius]|uniref:C2H2-type domain-containing protein n=1 Tax=Cimex lectularius TaxID=79782 RepID=A0A8I6SIL9_CIMLE|nr:uncharacterized protein LOC106665861 [Cimex lectularius]